MMVDVKKKLLKTTKVSQGRSKNFHKKKIPSAAARRHTIRKERYQKEKTRHFTAKTITGLFLF